MAVSSSSNPLQTTASTPHYLLSNICNLVPIRPNSTNCIQWKVQVTTILKAHALFGHIDGSVLAPNEGSSEYLPWTYRDQALITLINATLSPSAFSHVTFATTSSELWKSLENRYSSKTRSNIVALRSTLYTVQKTSSKTVDQLTRRVKDVVDKLAVASVKIDDEETLLHILNELPSEYGPFRTSIRTRSSPITLGELEVLLDVEEKSIAKMTPVIEPTSTAMNAYHGNLVPFPSGGASTPNANRRGMGGDNFRSQGRGDRGGRSGTQWSTKILHNAYDGSGFKNFRAPGYHGYGWNNGSLL